MTNKHTPDVFNVQVYGDMTAVTPTLSKARCRIFYKYENRNGGYITDEFAEKLLSTIPYAPIKGIYNPDEGDFTDHGVSRTEGRIYGVVMADPNLSWEKHVDEDGAVREYACVDVLLFTALYPVAKTIIGKPQSMELYADSIKGDWKQFGENSYFVYEDACFLGLQVLGDKTEPCFEGSSFFSLVESLQELVDEVKKYTLASHDLEGGNTMTEEKIEELETVEETVEEVAEEVTEEAVEVEAPEVHDVEAEVVETSAEEEDVVEETEEEIVEEPKEEDPIADEVEEATEKVDEELENVESPEANATLETESDFSANEITRLTEELETASKHVEELESELAELREFKLGVERKEKAEVIASYEDMLTEEIIETYTARIDEFSVRDLDKELAYEVKQSNNGIFAKMPETATPGIVPNSEPEMSGLEGVLSKYRK